MNQINLSIDLDTQKGITILGAIHSALATGAGKTDAKVANMKVVDAEEVTDGPAKAAPAAKAPVASPAKPAAPAARPAAPAARPAAAAKAPAPVAARPAPKAAVAKPAAVNFEDLDPESQLGALKAHATKHTKKGKTADIKALVANYGAERVSDLDPEYYLEFNDVLTRYSDGESVEDIFPNVD